MSDKKKQNYYIQRTIGRSIFDRRSRAQSMVDDANEDIRVWLNFLNQHGKLPGIDRRSISLVELRGSDCDVAIVHKVKNWMVYPGDDEYRTETTRISLDDFFHPEIDKEGPEQLDMENVGLEE